MKSIKVVILCSIFLLSIIIFSCSKSSSSNNNNNTSCTITNSQVGPLFSKVDSLISSSCSGSSCHIGGSNAGGYNFDSKCSIVDNWNAINNACVVRGNMPPSGFNSTQKAIITNWVNAGHQSTN